MKLNIVNILNTIAIENESENILNEIYKDFAKDPNGWLAEYYLYKNDIDTINSQTWNMVNFYESRYGINYVNNDLHFHIETPMSFDEFVTSREAMVNMVA